MSKRFDLTQKNPEWESLRKVFPLWIDYSPMPGIDKPTGKIQTIELERTHWCVAPVSRTRDSCAGERSNFFVLEEELKNIDADEENWEIAHYRHWGCGWFEIFIFNPSCEKVYNLMAEVYLHIKDYPLLDEGHYHELAWEEESSEEISSSEDSEEEE